MRNEIEGDQDIVSYSRSAEATEVQEKCAQHVLTVTVGLIKAAQRGHDVSTTREYFHKDA